MDNSYLMKWLSLGEYQTIFRFGICWLRWRETPSQLPPFTLVFVLALGTLNLWLKGGCHNWGLERSDPTRHPRSQIMDWSESQSWTRSKMPRLSMSQQSCSLPLSDIIAARQTPLFLEIHHVQCKARPWGLGATSNLRECQGQRALTGGLTGTSILRECQGYRALTGGNTRSSNLGECQGKRALKDRCFKPPVPEALPGASRLLKSVKYCS